jgi:hypothetical protein
VDGREAEVKKPIGVSEDGELVYPGDDQTQGIEAPLYVHPITGAAYYQRPLPLFDEFLQAASAAWNRRNKDI